jgi:hypothetical protein
MFRFLQKKKGKSMVRVTIDFEKKISRLFIFRFLWVPVLLVPAILCCVWFGILSFIHFWYMLFLGKRSEEIWVRQMHIINYLAWWQGYLRFFVNGHPKVWPW